MLSSLTTRTVDFGLKKISIYSLMHQAQQKYKKKETTKENEKEGLSFIRQAQDVAVLSVPNNASHPYLRRDVLA